jgi:hypothetical protein
MELHETVAKLKETYTQLPAKDHGFALSLVQQYEKKHSLSPKQQMWAEKLLSWTFTGAPAVEPEPKETVVLGNFSGVYALFAKAKEHLKYPKIRLMLTSSFSAEVAKPLMLALAGAKSKTPGVINVTDGGKYGENIWYGRINQDGNFQPNTKILSEELNKVVGLLIALALDTVGTVAAHGKLTGNCSFCDLPLTADNSTAVGYGPICAKNFGLWESWKSAAKNAGLPEAVMYSVPKIPAKVKLPTPVKKSAFKFSMAQKPVAQGASPASMVTAVTAPAKARVVSSVQAKKKLVVDKERDDYLF